ncbi:unnamed protein product [Dovyalis caffra]|uniref:Uncharacterized protein n=1 Tax=Dovyalis caffra TaxID=77055 RepID=A0AAV1RBL8_9ROSI|nr:unnamed protein product [Dovyalis caffra]
MGNNGKIYYLIIEDNATLRLYLLGSDQPKNYNSHYFAGFSSLVGDRERKNIVFPGAGGTKLVILIRGFIWRCITLPEVPRNIEIEERIVAYAVFHRMSRHMDD